MTRVGGLWVLVRNEGYTIGPPKGWKCFRTDAYDYILTASLQNKQNSRVLSSPSAGGRKGARGRWERLSAASQGWFETVLGSI